MNFSTVAMSVLLVCVITGGWIVTQRITTPDHVAVVQKEGTVAIQWTHMRSSTSTILTQTASAGASLKHKK